MTVVEVGPQAIRGVNDVAPELVSVVLECIDDELALLDDRPVPVREVWHEVMRMAVGTVADVVVLVHPTWWPSSRVSRVQAAARRVASTVVARQRSSVLRDRDRRAVVVEIDADFIVLTHPGDRALVLPRRGGRSAVADAVAAAVGAASRVLLDAPLGVDQSEGLGTAIGDRLRGNGIAVTLVDDEAVRRAAATVPDPPHGRCLVSAGDVPSTERRRGVPAALAGLVAATVLCGAFAVKGVPSGAAPTAVLVEGRVRVAVPADWAVQRVTSGPGSARVQVISPSDDVVLHVTQSAGHADGTLQATADSLRAALDEEPGGVFLDFNGADRRADRAAVTYREIRPAHHVAWAVLIDNAVRIAIGCQSAPGRDHLVREPCEQAIRSAHAVR